jgi:hypothetical protein
MRHHAFAVTLVSVLLLTTAGCVERKMYIRSEPTGAPVWLDETYVGVTPVEHSFAHYGMRRVRVGPLRDESGALTHLEEQVDWEVEPPWYEKFPIDFFFEVLYPPTLVDAHELPLVVLPERPAVTTEETEAQGQAQAESLLKRAAEFREKALSGIPEEAPELPEEGEE